MVIIKDTNHPTRANIYCVFIHLALRFWAYSWHPRPEKGEDETNYWWLHLIA